jgi:NADPH:quinone reductase-like Zn-dependent oxidoreductase
MKAIVHDRFGPPDVLRLEEIEEPEVTDDSVLVRVHASSVNPADFYAMSGPWFARPGMGLRRPKERRLGTDFSGVAEAVGKNVTHVRPGDAVFGARTGALAEYVSVQKAVVKKPESVGFEEAAGVAVAATTALQGLRDKANVRPGEKVLVNGASGGVGTFAVQIAKALGAEVTAVCSSRNVEQTRSLGADRVVDYTQEDFTRSGERYDVMIDVAGSKPWSELERVLTPDARYVLAGVSAKMTDRLGRKELLGPLAPIARLRLASIRSGRRFSFYIAKLTREDMAALADLMEGGKVRTVVDRTFPLSETADAFRYLAEGHARGKVVVTV